MPRLCPKPSLSTIVSDVLSKEIRMGCLEDLMLMFCFSESDTYSAFSETFRKAGRKSKELKLNLEKPK